MRAVHSEVDAEALRRRSASLLGGLGVIPFWVVFFVQFLEPEIGEEAARAYEKAVLFYGLSIVSFMGGGRWVMRLMAPDTKPGSVHGGLLGAVLPPLAAWATVLAADWPGVHMSPLTGLMVVALLLLFQLVQDWSQRHTLPAPWYLRLRVWLTAGATTPIFLGGLLATSFG